MVCGIGNVLFELIRQIRMNCLAIDYAEAAKTRFPRNITPCDAAGDCGYKNIQEGYGSGGFPCGLFGGTA